MQFYPKKPSSRERGFSVSCTFCRGKCPESTRRDRAHHLPTPRPRRTFAFALVRDASTDIRVLLEARAASKNARINFSLQVFRPSLLKSLSPFGGTRSHFRVKRRRVKIHTRPVSLERERPLLSSRAKTDDDETKEERRKTRGRTLVVLIIIANEDVISSRMRLQCPLFFYFCSRSFCVFLPAFESLNQEEATQKKRRKKKGRK